MKVFFKVLKNGLEFFSWIAGGFFFNTVDAVVFSGTAVSSFEVVKMAIFVVLFFSLKELISYIESEWDKISSDDYKKAKKKKAKKKKAKANKKLRFRKVKGFSKNSSLK